MNRVIFFSRNDFACAFNLEKIETIDASQLSNIGINDAIEFLEINKYFEEKIYLKKWSEIEIRNYEEKANQIKAIALRYLSNLEDKLVEELLQIESLYINRFWIYFEKYKLYKKIDEIIFNQILNQTSINHYNIIFQQQEIVQKYDKVLCKFLKKNICIEYTSHIL